MISAKTLALEPTPTEIEGPYFKLNSPHRSCMVDTEDVGTRIIISGKVLSTSGKPIPNAVVDFWSAYGVIGNYDMVGDKFRGHVFTDAEGHYSVETIMAACYQPRDAKHIHVKVQGVSRPVTTQLYFSDDPGKDKDRFFKKELEVAVQDGTDGKKLGHFDFVIPQVTEKENVTPESLAARV
ncbi:MAG: intradiol ring-cleavage dioxygenase [Chloroflexota bacterium]